VPTYEYVCGSCARRIDVLHGIHAEGPRTCEACGGRLRKAISAAAVVFKGSGWAKKDAARAAARPVSDQSGSDGTLPDGSPSDGSPSDRSSADSDGAKGATPARPGTDAETGRSGAPAPADGTSAKPPLKDTPAPARAKGPSGRTTDKGSTSSRPGD